MIYTDGGCHNTGNNKGLGAYAFLKDEWIENEIIIRCKKCTDTTNNRMELNAILDAAQFYDENHIVITSDSGYCVKGFMHEAYLDKWVTNGWKLSSGGKVKNIDLWKQLYSLSFQKSIMLKLCRGHNKDRDAIRAYYNDICDRACTFVMNDATIPISDNRIVLFYDRINDKFTKYEEV